MASRPSMVEKNTEVVATLITMMVHARFFFLWLSSHVNE